VENGAGALECLSRSDYDLILMDCQMPEMDGYKATHEIRRREGGARRTRIIGLTAHALPGDRDNCIRAGMDDYLSKPVMPEDLGAVIDKWAMVVEAQRASGSGASSGVEMISPSAVVATTLAAARPDEAPINEAVLAELRGYQKPGEPDFVTELIGIFNNDVINRLGQMKAGVEASDARRVSQAAHALKGASGELGAASLQAICSRLEESTAQGSLEEAGPMLREIEAEADRVLAALAAYCVATPRQLAEPAA